MPIGLFLISTFFHLQKLILSYHLNRLHMTIEFRQIGSTISAETRYNSFTSFIENSIFDCYFRDMAITINYVNPYSRSWIPPLTNPETSLLLSAFFLSVHLVIMSEKIINRISSMIRLRKDKKGN